MTCIIGLVHDGKVYMGGDSCYSCGNIKGTLKSPKIFKYKNMLLGTAGSLRFMQSLKYDFAPPIDSSLDVIEYIVSEFIPDLREVLRKAGIMEEKDKIETTDSRILVGYRGRLFIISSNFAIIEDSNEYLAIGGADEVALGSLYTTRGMSVPEFRIQEALRAAAHFNPYVSEPFTIEVLE